MKKRKVWRYSCEHCGKSSCSGGHTARHERHCTKNPQRICRMCVRVGDIQLPVTELIAAIEFAPMAEFPELTERRYDRLLIVANHCPACILSAIRQAPVREDVAHEAGGFRFKDEAKLWIEDYRASCFGTGYDGDGPQVFDREEWIEHRAERYAKAETRA